MSDVEDEAQVPTYSNEGIGPTLTKQEEERRLIRSYIAVLTSALGGVDYSSEETNPPYRLGDEAFACLKDIKKWLKSYDEERNTWEVAVACAESGLVVNDLIVILCDWEAGELNKNGPEYKKKMNDKIALACLELLVPLTWPLQLSEGMYKGQLQHYSNLKKHQVNYKKNILSYRGGKVLKAVVRLALPIMATPRSERSGRDNGILRLCTFFFRNVLAIEPASITKETSKHLKPSDIADNMPSGVNAEDISLGACLVAFEENLVFQYLLTICGSINKDFDGQFLSMACLEMIYDLTRGVRASVVIQERRKQVPLGATPPPSASTISTNQSTTSLGLSDLLSKESEMKTKFKSVGSSRHSRFGTLLSLQTPDQGRLTLSGQQNLSERQNTIAAFDSHKKWHKAQPFRYDSDDNVVFTEVHLSHQPNKILNKFTNDFLDGGFNPLINAISKDFTSESEDRPNTSKIHFLLVIAWFLEAERHRNGAKANNIDYGLIVAGLTEKTFILVFKYLSEGFDNKVWSLVHAAVITFKEIVTTTNFMALSESEEDKEIATNIKERLFHKKHYLDLMAKVPTYAYKHSPTYVNNCVDLVDVVLKTLEEFANEDMVLFIQSNRKQRKRKNVSREQEEIDDMEGSDGEELERTSRKLSAQRKFDFKKYQTQFVNAAAIETYMAYLSRFEDLSEKDIKKGLKFLHRAFYIQKNHVVLFRLDFMLLLHRLLSGDGLPKRSNIRKHFSEFLSYYMKKLKKSLDTTPSLYIELLFDKFHDTRTEHYLGTGEVYVEPKKIKRVTKYALLKGDEDMDLETKVSILVAGLIDDDMKHLAEWVGEELEKALMSRIHNNIPREQEDDELPEQKPIVDFVLKSNNVKLMNSLIINPKLRYLISLAGCELPSQTGDNCILKADSDTTRLSETVTYIKMYLIQPVAFDNGKNANDFIKIKQIRGAFEGDSDDGYNGGGDDVYGWDDDDIAFEVKGEKVDEGYNDDILDNLEDAIGKTDRALPKGVARSKNKPKREGRRRKSENADSDSDDDDRPRQRARKKRRNRGPALPYHDLSNDEGEAGAPKKKAQIKSHDYVSAKYVNDSADESEDEEFFANEQRLREILIKNNGILGAEQLQEFVNRTMNGAASKSEFANGNVYISEDEKEEPKAAERDASDSESDLENSINRSEVLDQGSDTGSLSDEQMGEPAQAKKATFDDGSDLEGPSIDFGYDLNNDSDDEDLMLIDEVAVNPPVPFNDEKIKDESDEGEPSVAPRRKTKVVFSDDDDE
ncbi:unnamed protein product [Wickerhamomyces anomalus]